MRIALLLGAALVLVAASRAAAPAPLERVVVADRGDLYLVPPGGGARDRLTRTPAAESEPAVSPDGRRLAFVREGRTVVVPVHGGRPRQIGPPASSPSWSPDGRRLAVAAADGLRLLTVATGASELVAATGGAHNPDWSPDGRRIVFALGGDLRVLALPGRAIVSLTEGPNDDAEPAWSPDGRRIAFTSDRDGGRDVYAIAADGSGVRRLTTDPAEDLSPVFSPDGARLAFVRAGSTWIAAAAGGAERALVRGTDPDWARIAPPEPPPPPPGELLPDLDQRAPARLSVLSSGGRFKLGFASAVDNVGSGPLWIRASRRSRANPTMRADQVVRLRNGGLRVYRRVGVVRYTWSSSHSHWHFLGFERYELRRASDFRLLVRDRKSGFCLADHYGLAARRVRVARPRFLGNCASGRPDALRVEQGSSVGFTDLYPPHFHGQNVDVTGIPPGRYWLVHRANPHGTMRERTLANNAAAVLVRLTWPNGRRSTPRLSVLRRCEGAERC